MCDTVKMSNWGRVWYTNILAGVLLAAVFPFCSQEHAALAAAGFTAPQTITLALSCIVGVAMSHAGMGGKVVWVRPAAARQQERSAGAGAHVGRYYLTD
jgi:hypothetical protein